LIKLLRAMDQGYFEKGWDWEGLKC
jgi:hypothetical protein